MNSTLCSVLLLVALIACSEQKAADPAADPAAKTPTADKPATATAKAPAKDKPAPPKEAYEGKARVVNLYMKDGKPAAVDVWATRSFKYGPIKLASNVAFGTASDWFQSPKGSPTRVFVAGAPPDSKDHLGGVFHPKKGDHITAILHNDKDGKPTNGNFWDTSDDVDRSGTPDAPPAGKGYVVLRAGQLRPHQDAMKATTGGWAFRVGDGKGECRRQRVEEMGFTASLLGGTQPIELDLPPGRHKLTFHKGLAKGCAEDSKVYELELVVKADAATLVALYTPDIKTVAHVVLDMPVNKAKPYGTNKKLKDQRDAERAAKKKAP